MLGIGDQQIPTVQTVLAAIRDQVARSRWVLVVEDAEQVGAAAAVDAVDDGIELDVGHLGKIRPCASSAALLGVAGSRRRPV